MTVSQHLSRARGRVTRRRHHIHHRERCHGRDAADRVLGANVDRRVVGASAQTPSGPEAAEEALAWLTRELSWQCTLDRLEGRADGRVGI